MAKNGSPSDNFISVKKALSAPLTEVAGWADSLNPGIATILKLLDFDRVYRKADGVSIWDGRDEEYLDFVSNYGSLNLGHNHPRVLEAIESVGEAPNFVQWLSLSPVTLALAANLARITPGDLSNTYLCSSGAEATEAALKLARIATGRRHLIATHNGFHGKTFGALSVTGKESYRKPFEPLLDNVTFVPFGEIEPLEEALSAEPSAAFIVEPIQGEGGVVLPPDGYLREVAALCRKHGTLFVLDEIQTGLGRTGRLFACEWEDVVPDILLLAKSLGGGIMPIGAMITTRAFWDSAYGGINRSRLQTSTFAGGARACAAAIATLEVLLEGDLVQNAAIQGEYLTGELRKIAEKHSMLREVRGKGLLVGIEFYQPAGGILDRISVGMVNKLSEEYLAAFVASDLLKRHRIMTAYTLNNPNVIRVAPPLMVTREQIDYFLQAFEDSVSKNRGFLRTALRTGKTAARKMVPTGKPS